MIHEMVVGSSPFSDGSSTNMTQLFTNIVTTLYHGVKFCEDFNEKAGSPEVSALITKLCAFKSFDRLGSGGRGMDDVKNHGHFKGFDFGKLRNREIDAPWVPKPEDLDKWREEEENREAEPWEEEEEEGGDVWAEWC
jgi:hypothetical protein